MGAGATPAGWYPDVERPGGERYWDGSLWTEHRRNTTDAAGGGSPMAPASPPPAFGQQPPSDGQQPPIYGAPPGGAFGQPGQQPAFGSPAGYSAYGAVGPAYPKSQVAGWALGLSIAGLVLVCCGGILLSIPGAIMGWTTMKAIDRGEKNPDQRGMAKAAFVVGVVGLSLFATLLLFWVVSIAVSA